MSSWLPLLAAILLTAGCGFHLRGSGAPPLANLPALSVTFADDGSALSRTVSRALKERGWQPSEADSAALSMRVTRQSESRRGLSLTQGIQVAEFELTVEMTLSVRDQANVVLPETTLSARRVYSRDQRNLLNNESEEAVLWEEMRVEVAEQTVRVLGTLADRWQERASGGS